MLPGSSEPQKAYEILKQMLKLYENGDIFAKPNCLNYNAVLNAASRTPSLESAKLAHDMLRKMELPVSKGGFDVEPDRLSYALTILACSRCPYVGYAAQRAEENLEKLEARAKMEAQKREEVSSAAPPSVTLDIESFNVVLTAISKCRQRDGPERALRIIRRMEQYANSGQETLRPNTRSWNAVLNSIARAMGTDDGGSPSRAEDILNHMHSLSQNGVPNAKPDAFSYAAVLSAYQKSSDPSAAQRADKLVRRMEELYESGKIDVPPDVYQ